MDLANFDLGNLDITSEELSFEGMCCRALSYVYILGILVGAIGPLWSEAR